MTCDRVLIINQGRVVAQGTPADLRREILGGAKYEVEIAGDLNGLPIALGTIDQTLHVAAQGEPNADGFRKVTLALDSEAEIGEPLLRTLLAQNLRVRALNRTHPTLEDVFLAATRRSWDAVAPPAGNKSKTARTMTGSPPVP
jgi:ABC-2 type transport system ATP-binding protein